MDPYTPLAPAYDAMTALYDYDRWLSTIEDVAAGFRPPVRTVLDIGCGTGSSFLPLSDRGYDVTACDVSEAMLEQARRRVGDRPVRLLQADMRRLPVLGAFDLVLCLDDAINHLLSGPEVSDAFAGAAANLAPDGVFVFDVNTLATMRSSFSTDWRHEDDEVRIVWRGRSRDDVPLGGRVEAQVEIVRLSTGDRRLTMMRERHHPLVEVTERLVDAGLTPVAIFGQLENVRLRPDADELRHRKALFFAMHSGEVRSR